MSQSDDTTLTQDEAYGLLTNARRRYVISYLRNRNEPVTVNELAEEVAAWENETSVEELTDQQIKRVYVSLYQTHLPKFSESGIIDYDRDEGLVELTDSVEELDDYVPERRDSGWSDRDTLAAIAVVGLLVYGLLRIASSPAAGPPLDVLAVVAVAILLMVAFIARHNPW